MGVNLFDQLSLGAKNAKTAGELRDLLGYSTTRQGTKEIERLSRHGAVIIAVNNGCNGANGFFLPAYKEEAVQYLQTMYSRVKHMETNCRLIREYVKEGGVTDATQWI